MCIYSMGVGDGECQPGQATIHVIKPVFFTARSNIICPVSGDGDTIRSITGQGDLQRVAGEEASRQHNEQ